MKVLLEKESNTNRKNEQYEIEVNNLSEAVSTYQKAMQNFGSSDYQYAETGQITLDDGTKNYISMNGRVWDDKYWISKNGKKYNGEAKEIVIDEDIITTKDIASPEYGFIKKYFQNSDEEIKILTDWLRDTKQGFPNVSDPSIYYTGLIKAGTMADNENYMTSFTHLRELYQNEQKLDKLNYEVAIALESNNIEELSEAEVRLTEEYDSFSDPMDRDETVYGKIIGKITEKIIDLETDLTDDETKNIELESKWKRTFKDKRSVPEYKAFIGNFEKEIMKYLDVNKETLNTMSIKDISVKLEDFEPMKLMLENKLYCTSCSNKEGVNFNIKLVFNDDKYGLNNCLTYEKYVPLVEFYDNEHKHTELGQFISRYAADTLLGKDGITKEVHQGTLCLDGGVPQWSVDAGQMNKVIDWLENHSKVQQAIQQKDWAGLFKEAEKEQKTTHRRVRLQ